MKTPSHYRLPSGLEALPTIGELADQWVARGLSGRQAWALGNCVKYLWRAGAKGAADEDLRKAREYLDEALGQRTPAAAHRQPGPIESIVFDPSSAACDGPDAGAPKAGDVYARGKIPVGWLAYTTDSDFCTFAYRISEEGWAYGSRATEMASNLDDPSDLSGDIHYPEMALVARVEPTAEALSQAIRNFAASRA